MAAPHVHVVPGQGEAKFWLIPEIELAKNYRYSWKQLKAIQSMASPDAQTPLRTSRRLPLHWTKVQFVLVISAAMKKNLSVNGTTI